MTGATSFSPLPVQAIGDARLSGLDLRVLACIAFHDRMSRDRGKGQGCLASHQTMATKVGCHYTRLSSAISKLAKLGYLERVDHPLNKRLRVYRVLYDTLPNGKGLPDASPETVGETANDADGTVCRQNLEATEIVAEGSLQYISLSDERYVAEASEHTPHKRRNLRCAAAGDEHGPSIGAELARYERRLKAEPNALNLPAWADWLMSITEDLGSATSGDPDGGRAYRLYEQTLEAMSVDQYQSYMEAA